VIHSGDKGSGLTNALLFAWREEGGMLGSLGERRLSYRRGHLLLVHRYLRYRLETGGADLLTVAGSSFYDNWLSDEGGLDQMRLQAVLSENLVPIRIIRLEEHVFYPVLTRSRFMRLAGVEHAG